MFLIDFEKKGNVIRLYFGEDDQYWGDDWNDAPYEHNAGQVYDEFVKCYIEYAFPLNYFITEPADDYSYRGNSPYSKQSMKNEKCPCLIITKDDENYSELFLSYSILLSGEDKEIRRENPQTLMLYFNAEEDKVDSLIKNIGGVKIAYKENRDDN